MKFTAKLITRSGPSKFFITCGLLVLIAMFFHACQKKPSPAFSRILVRGTIRSGTDGKPVAYQPVFLHRSSEGCENCTLGDVVGQKTSDSTGTYFFLFDVTKERSYSISIHTKSSILVNTIDLTKDIQTIDFMIEP